MQGLFLDTLDPAFLPNFSVWIGVVFTFYIAAVVGTVVGRYRSQDNGLFAALFQHLAWLPLLVTFFSGLSWHVLCALAAVSSSRSDLVNLTDALFSICSTSPDTT